MPTTAVYRFSGPANKWRFSMATERVSVLNLSQVQITVEADHAGLPYDPRSATVEFAFLEAALTNPSGGDWKVATWDVTKIGTYVAQCNVGPSGAAVLAVGEYYTWIRLTDVTAGETPVECVGKLIVS